VLLEDCLEVQVALGVRELVGCRQGLQRRQRVFSESRLESLEEIEGDSLMKPGVVESVGTTAVTDIGCTDYRRIGDIVTVITMNRKAVEITTRFHFSSFSILLCMYVCSKYLICGLYATRKPYKR
jgi:hypothetical protein